MEKMSTLTVRLTKDQHARLRTLAAHRGIRMNKLFEDFSSKALAEFDTEVRFLARAAKGNPEQGLAILDRLDEYYGKSG